MKLSTIIYNVWDFSWRFTVIVGGVVIVIHVADVMGVLR